MAVNFVLIDHTIIQLDTQIGLQIIKESEKYIRTEINSSVQETRGMYTMIVPSQWTISRLLRVSLENWAIMRSR